MITMTKRGVKRAVKSAVSYIAGGVLLFVILYACIIVPLAMMRG